MTNQNLPTDVNAMIQLIESGYDRPALLERLAQAQAQADHAAQQLAAAQQALAEHEATAPTDVATWAATKRRLSDAISVYEQLAQEAGAQRDIAQRAIFEARRPVIEALGAQLHAQRLAAYASDARREDELRAELDAVRAGRTPQTQAVIMAQNALNNAAGALRYVN